MKIEIGRKKKDPMFDIKRLQVPSYKGDFKTVTKIELIDAATSDNVLWTFWATQNTLAS